MIEIFCGHFSVLVQICILEYGGIGLNTAKNGKNTWKKFGGQGSTRRTLWITWVRLDSLGLTLVYFDSLGFTGFTWVHLNQLKITLMHLGGLWLVMFDLV